MGQRIVDWQALRGFVQELFMAKGLSEGDAFVVADCMVDADLTGVETHGVFLVNTYLTRIEKGVINVKTNFQVVNDYPGSFLIDGHDSLGMVTSRFAMEKCIEKAKTSGCCLGMVAQSNHFGMSAYYVKMAAQENMIGCCVANAPANIAPWGSPKPYFGTNPIAISAPTKGQPLVLDMATSVSSMGKINLAAKLGKDIPAGWAIDGDGRPTTDAKAAQNGTLLPIGGPKGYGLTLFIDVLAGLMTGSLNGPHIAYVVSKVTEFKPQRLGHAFLAIDVSKFVPLESFLERIEIMKAEVKAFPKNNGVAEILMPGEIELNRKEERLRNGIPLSEVIYAQLLELAAKHGVKATI
jgi:LDH2 family malate/lactate/ureidoglycolate dehydrogenase